MTRAGLRPVLSDAFAVALSAKTGDITPLAVDHLRGQAEELLPEGTPFRAAVLHFASLYEVFRRDPVRLVEMGDELARAVEIALLPEPPDLHRSDIHG